MTVTRDVLQVGADLESVRFLFDGQRLRPDQTPQDVSGADSIGWQAGGCGLRSLEFERCSQTVAHVCMRGESRIPASRADASSSILSRLVLLLVFFYSSSAWRMRMRSTPWCSRLAERSNCATTASRRRLRPAQSLPLFTSPVHSPPALNPCRAACSAFIGRCAVSFASLSLAQVEAHRAGHSACRRSPFGCRLCLSLSSNLRARGFTSSRAMDLFVIFINVQSFVHVQEVGHSFFSFSTSSAAKQQATSRTARRAFVLGSVI